MLNQDIYNLIFKEYDEYGLHICQAELLFVNREIYNYYSKYLKNVRYIFIDNNSFKGCKITDAEFSQFYKKHITHLNLENCNDITNRSLSIVYNFMKNIKILNIKGTKITTKHLKHIYKLDKLETLYIDNVSIASLEYLSKLNNLNTLIIHFSIKGMPNYQYFNYFIDFKSLKKLTYNSDVNYSIRLPAEYIKDMKILKYLELKEHTINKDTIKYLMGNIDNILLYDCDIDIYTTRYILKHINRFKSFKIGVYNKKYNNKQLLIMNDINKSINNFGINIE